MKVFQPIGTHPRVLLVNQLQSREEKWYRASTVFTLTSRRTEIEKYASSKKKARLHSIFPPEEWVLLAAATKEPEEREFVVDSGARMSMVSKKGLNSAELETMRTSRSPTSDGQRRGANEKKRQKMSNNLPYLSKLCFMKKLPQFLGETM